MAVAESDDEGAHRVVFGVDFREAGGAGCWKVDGGCCAACDYNSQWEILVEGAGPQEAANHAEDGARNEPDHGKFELLVKRIYL